MALGLEGRVCRNDGIEPVDCRIGLLLLLFPISTPGRVQYTGGVCDRGGVEARADERPRDGGGVLARGLGTLLSVSDLRRLGGALFSVIVVDLFSLDFCPADVCQVGRGNLDGVEDERLVVSRSVSWFIRTDELFGWAFFWMELFFIRCSPSEGSLTSLSRSDG